MLSTNEAGKAALKFLRYMASNKMISREMFDMHVKSILTEPEQFSLEEAMWPEDTRTAMSGKTSSQSNGEGWIELS